MGGFGNMDNISCESYIEVRLKSEVNDHFKWYSQYHPLVNILIGGV